MNIVSLIGQIFEPAVRLVDELHTSDEERLEIKKKMMELQMQSYSIAMEYQTKLVEAQSTIIAAEAAGDSWLQRNWRPITMVTFLGLVVSYWFGYAPDNMTQETINHLFELVKIGLGGYIVGRSVEKVAPNMVEAYKARKDK